MNQNGFAWRGGGASHVFLASCLVLVTVLLFHPVLGFEFIAWDDDVNVYRNPFMGYSPLGNLVHFWTAPYQKLYIPVTYTMWALIGEVSLALSGRLSPVYFHLSNLIGHALNGLMIVWIIRLWAPKTPSLALFAGAFVFLVHPMQVEAVAWVTGFKDVFSAAFALGSLAAFLKGRDPLEERAGTWKIVSWFLYVGAILAKPSQLFLVAVFFLIEISDRRKRSSCSAIAGALVFVLPAIWMIWFTCRIQAGEGQGSPVPPWARPMIALDAIGFYAWKTIVPHPIGMDYGRMPQEVLGRPWGLAGAFCLLGLSAWLVTSIRRRMMLPGLIFWGLALTPVLGLQPFAFQDISTVADRYAYLAMAGWAFAASRLMSDWPSRPVYLLVGFYGLALLGASTAALPHWAHSTALFTQARRVNPHSFIAHYGLGVALQERGQFSQSLEYFRQALALKSDYGPAHTRLGSSLIELGRDGEALIHYRRALQINPRDTDAHNNLGVALARSGKWDAALAHYQTALDIHPYNLEALNNSGLALAESGKYKEAELRHRSALKIDSGNAETHGNLATVLLRQGDRERALRHYMEAVRLQPGNAGFRYNLGNALVEMGRVEDGLTHMKKAVLMEPRNAGILAGLAWVLATSPQIAVRDGAQAVRLAWEALKIGGEADPQILRVLAAAQAENGEFSEALRTCRQALEVFGGDKQSGLARAIRRDLEFYQRHKPFPAIE